MIFTETELSGAFIMQLKKLEDDRGFFAQSWSPREMVERGLEAPVVENAVSFNKRKGTLRGMHYQRAPYGQTKIVRCTMGSIYDVIIDLRTASPTFKQWIGVELTARNRLMLYVPKDFAHGYQTLEDDTEVFYQISEAHHPDAEGGLRWDDPVLGIHWPLLVTITSERDRQFALL